MLEQLHTELLKLPDLITTDIWVSAILGTVLVLLATGLLSTIEFVFILMKNIFSKNLKEARLYKGEYFLYHWNLIKLNGNTICASKIKISWRWNGSLGIKQINLKDGRTFFIGAVHVDAQNLYCVMDGADDTDSKLIILHKFYTAENELLYNAVGTMVGITTNRNPYATDIILTKKPLPEDVLINVLGTRKVIISSKADKDKLVDLESANPELFTQKVDVAGYISSLG